MDLVEIEIQQMQMAAGVVAVFYIKKIIMLMLEQYQYMLEMVD